MRRDRQIIRLLSIFQALQRREPLHVNDLATRHNVRRETVYRDLRALEDVGIPITGDTRGVKSRPGLPPGYATKTVAIPFSTSELIALAFAVSTTDHLAGTPLRDDLVTAVDKVRAHLPGPEQDRLALASPLFGPDRKGAKAYASHRATIATLCRAMLERHRCLVEYQSPERSAPTRFRIDPYRLFEFKSGLYLFAHVPAHQAIITLAVERIRGLAPTDEPFEIAKDFSFEKMRDQAFGVMTGEPRHVVVRFRKDVAPYVRARTWHPTQQITELRTGDLKLSFRAGGDIEIVRWVLGWGREAKLLHPTILRRQIADELRAAGRLYRRSRGLG